MKITKKKIFIFLLVLVAAVISERFYIREHFVSFYPISGVIIDSQNKKPISGVTVIIRYIRHSRDLRCQRARLTKTDSHGEFNFPFKLYQIGQALNQVEISFYYPEYAAKEVIQSIGGKVYILGIDGKYIPLYDNPDVHDTYELTKFKNEKEKVKYLDNFQRQTRCRKDRTYDKTALALDEKILMQVLNMNNGIAGQLKYSLQKEINLYKSYIKMK